MSEMNLHMKDKLCEIKSDKNMILNQIILISLSLLPKMLDYTMHYCNNIIVAKKYYIFIHHEEKKQKLYPFRTVAERKQD